MDMRAVICAACRTLLGYADEECTERNLQMLAAVHKPVCSATPEEYEQAIVDLKFRQITNGLDL